MAIFAPLIGGLALDALGGALLSGALSLGLGALARQLAPVPADHRLGSRGMRLSLKLESNADREVAIGTVATAGSLAYHNTYGPNGTDYVQLVYALADHECDSLVGIEIDGVVCTLGAYETAGFTVAEFPGVMWVEFHSGAAGQAADAELVAHATSNSWTEADRGEGVCYVRVTMLYDANLYKSGLPHFLFVIKGAKLYDWRLDTSVGGNGPQRWGDASTYAWSDNPAVGLYNFRRGIYVGGQRLAGLATSAASLPLDAATAAANICDEQVQRRSGVVEPRYRACGMISTAAENRPTVREFVTATGGSEIDSGGTIKLLPGVARAPVMVLSDADLMSDGDVEITPRLSRNDLSNAIYGTFHDPDQHFESVSLPPRVSQEDIDQDGIELQRHYTLDYVPSQTQGQRILEIFRRRERHQRRIKARFRSRCAVLEAGDWIVWTSDRYGFQGQAFEVLSVELGLDLTVSLALRDVDASIYAYTATADEIDASHPQTLASGGATFTTVQNFALLTVTVDGAATSSRPGLHATWTPITDITVASLLIQYRRVGDAGGLTVTVLDAQAGSYTWITGVQGDVQYEARIKPITNPERATSWTGWTPTTGHTTVQVVAVARTAVSVPDGTITPAMLSEESRRQLALSGAISDVLDQQAVVRTQQELAAEATLRAFIATHRAQTGITVEAIVREQEAQVLVQQLTVVAAHLAATTASVATLEQTVVTANAAFATRISDVAAHVDATSAGLAATSASVATLEQSVAAANSAFATRISGVETTVGGHTSSLQVIQTSINGIQTRFAVELNSDGHVIGMIQLDGTNAGTSFTVVANKFLVALPNTTGGAPTPVFGISTVNGVVKLALRGDMLADGTIQARHIQVSSLDAISATLGIITTGRIQSSNGLSYVDLRPGTERIRMVTA